MHAGTPLILAIGRVGRRAFPREGRVSVMSPGARNRMAREDFLGSASTQRPAIGVQSSTSWPCGQDSVPESECHQRRDLRHEAGGAGPVLTAGLVPYFYPALHRRSGGRVPI